MKAIIDIGDQKTGSKSRQTFLRRNSDELSRNGCCLLESTKVVDYDMGLAAYAGRKAARDTFLNKKNISNGSDLDRFIEEGVEKELKENACHTVFFSFEGLMHLEVSEVEKLTSMLYQHFSEIFVIGFLRRQDRKAVSAYTTRLKNGAATDLNVLYFSNGNPRGADYYERFERWRKFVPKENITFINYDECEDVTRKFVDVADIPGELIFDEARRNTSMSALGSEVLRRFNKDLAHRNEYKNRKERVRTVIRNYYTGESFRPAKKEAEALFWKFSDSNEKLAKSLGAKEKYFFDENFSEYPDEFSPFELSLSDVEEYVKKALKASK